MSKLKDPNIVRVLGVVTQDEPYCVIVEYMKYGDLNQYLQQHCPESTVARNQQARMLRYGEDFFLHIMCWIVLEKAKYVLVIWPSVDMALT